MIKVNYYPKSVKDKKHVPLFMRLCFDSKKFKFGIGVVIDKTQWSSTNQRIKKSRQREPYNNHNEINQLLDKYTQIVTTLYWNCKNQVKPFTRQLVKNALADKLDGSLREKKNFFKAFDEFIDLKKPSISKETLRKYNSTKNYLLGLESHFETEITFNNIDAHFFRDLQEYAFDVNAHSTNYFVKHVNILKMFMKWAGNRDYHGNHKYLEFSATEVQTEIIYLTFEELNKLINAKMPNKKLENVKDMFLFSCSTGLRYGDLKSLRTSHIRKTKHKGKDVFFLEKKAQKGRKIIKVPLSNLAIIIYNKYKDQKKDTLLNVPANSNVNKYLKEACEIACINADTEKTRHSGNNIKTKIYKKWELVTCHVGRKTFISLMHANDMDSKTIKSLTGHSTDKAFERYLHISDTQKVGLLDKLNSKIIIE